MKPTITARVEIGSTNENDFSYWFARSVPNSDFERGFDLLIWTTRRDDLKGRVVRKFQLHGMDYIEESTHSKTFTRAENKAFLRNLDDLL